MAAVLSGWTPTSGTEATEAVMYANPRRARQALQVILDIFCLRLIWLCSIHARISLNPFLNEHVTEDKAHIWAPPLLLVLALWLATSIRFGLYRTPEIVSFWSIHVSAFKHTVVLALVTAVVTFFSRGFGESLSRMFVPLMLPIALIVLCISRYAAAALTPLVEKHCEQPLRIALIGDWEKSKQFIEHMQAAQATSFRGLIVPESDLAQAKTGSMPVLGTTGQIAELINRERLDQVMILNASLPDADFEHCSQVLRRMNVPVRWALGLAPDPIHVDVNTNYGLPFVELIPIQFTRRQEMLKRIFDVFGSAFLLLLVSPLLVAIAIWIKATSKGPVLHTSPRIGKGGRRFTFLKFRSMYVDSDRQTVAGCNEKTGHIFKMKNDPRVTSAGRFLRRYSLDELPQLINILGGEMSFVGPRPLPAADLGPDGMSKQYAAWSEGRASVHPGLTGLWQVSGRSELSFEDMVQLDLWYIQNWSLALDIRIILDTPMLVLRGAGAY
jgi:exopolysaccharide biosynthesis polyprenyl glycosylphosphotransferase